MNKTQVRTKINKFPNECTYGLPGCCKPTNGHPSRVCYSCREKIAKGKIAKGILKKEKDYDYSRTVCRVERASSN